MSQVKIGIIGTGSIAETHAEVIAKDPTLDLVAVADVNENAARSFAKSWGAKQTFASAKELAASGAVDAVHILTPPDTHAALACKFLDSNIATFAEKPVATNATDLKLLDVAVEKEGCFFGVNQNSLFHPAFEALLKVIDSGEIGPVQSLQCHYAAPLRQLESGQFGHWMFAKTINILLEQAVHPLAQIQFLLGNFEDVESLVAAPVKIGDGSLLFPTTLMNLQGRRASGQLHYSVGATYPRWTLNVLCTDGVAVADMMSNRLVVDGRSRWLEASDHYLTGKANARQTLSQSRRNFVDYAKSMIGFKGRCDAFYMGMAGSIKDFHSARLNGNNPRADYPFARGLIKACLSANKEMDKASQKTESATNKQREKNTREPHKTVDVVILGGTGFIGRYVVEKCVAEGMTVRVIARNLRNLPSIFYSDQVDLVSADLRDPAATAEVMNGTQKVINLAHGGGGTTAEAVLQAMLGSAEAVFAACRDAGVKRLIHIGSIAGLYLGAKNSVITGDTAPDPQPDKRADYARAKAYTDLRMLALSGDGPSITILRPGIVVGKGTPAAHSGLGVFNNDQHCLGWSDGDIKLPFVLATDVADAAVSALTATDIAGKCYNLCGDVTWTAREYFSALRKATGRPFEYHPQSPAYITFIENIKVLIKKIAGKKQSFHSLRDFRSRAMYADFNCDDAKKALAWQPVADPDEFYKQAIAIHASSEQEN